MRPNAYLNATKFRQSTEKVCDNDEQNVISTGCSPKFASNIKRIWANQLTSISLVISVGTEVN